MVHPLFKNIVDRIFVQDAVLHRLVQKLKNETPKERDNDANSKN